MTDEEMTDLTRGTSVIAEKVRLLHDSGCTRTEIARFLGIKYQHVHNVLKRSNRLGDEVAVAAAVDRAEPGPDAAIHLVTVESGGKVTLPRGYLDAQGIADGDVVVCRDVGGTLQIVTRAAAAEELRTAMLQRMPGEAALLDALIRADFRKP